MDIIADDFINIRLCLHWLLLVIHSYWFVELVCRQDRVDGNWQTKSHQQNYKERISQNVDIYLCKLGVDFNCYCSDNGYRNCYIISWWCKTIDNFNMYTVLLGIHNHNWIDKVDILSTR